MAVEEVDIIVHIPLEEEFLQFISVFPTTENLSTELDVTYRVSAPSGLRVIVTLQRAMGRGAAAVTCTNILQRFTCRLYVCLGIAGGVSKDLVLGDVCYTGNLLDVYDNSKVTDCEEGGVEIAFSPEHYTTGPNVTAAVGFVRTMTELRPLYEYWQEDQHQWMLGEITKRDLVED